jgi:peptide/nickel transport system permease protein
MAKSESTFTFEPPTWKDTLKMCVRQVRKLRARIIPEGLVLVMIMLFCSSFIIETISPYDAERGHPSDRNQAPTYEVQFWDGHFMGTDQQGRDVFVRVIKGARFSFYVAIIALAIGGSVGLVVGIVAGYFGGKIDNVLMRCTDIVLAIPVIFAALLLAALYSPSLKLVAIALGINLWALYARMIRGESLSLAQRDFVKLSRIAGAGGLRIMIFHIFPHVTSTWLVLLSLQVGSAILAEASLSFLGAGIPPPTPAWGQMAAAGRSYIETAWWISVYPGVAILLVVLCFNLVGDWARDRLDPRFQ